MPSANTDGTRPANVERVDVYALTRGRRRFPTIRSLKHGTKIGERRASRRRAIRIRPSKPTNPTTRSNRRRARPRSGRASRASPRSSLRAGADAGRSADEHDGRRQEAADAAGRRPPLVGCRRRCRRAPTSASASRRAAATGPLSKRVTVPLVPPPPPPRTPTVDYNETAVTVTWPPVTLRRDGAGCHRPMASSSRGRSACRAPTLSYNVYEVAPLMRRPPRRRPS